MTPGDLRVPAEQTRPLGASPDQQLTVHVEPRAHGITCPHEERDHGHRCAGYAETSRARTSFSLTRSLFRGAVRRDGLLSTWSVRAARRLVRLPLGRWLNPGPPLARHSPRCSRSSGSRRMATSDRARLPRGGLEPGPVLETGDKCTFSRDFGVCAPGTAPGPRARRFRYARRRA